MSARPAVIFKVAQFTYIWILENVFIYKLVNPNHGDKRNVHRGGIRYFFHRRRGYLDCVSQSIVRGNVHYCHVNVMYVIHNLLFLECITFSVYYQRSLN